MPELRKALFLPAWELNMHRFQSSNRHIFALVCCQMFFCCAVMAQDKDTDGDGLSNNLMRIYVPFGGGDRRDLVNGVTYRFQPRNENPDYRWHVPERLTILRSANSER